MGNMPSKLVGKAMSLVLALLAGAAAYLLGGFVGGKLAGGYTFDWYVRPPTDAFPANEALAQIGLAAGIVGFVCVALALVVVATLTFFWARRARYSPPRYAEPVSVDVHLGRLGLLLPLGAALLIVLGFFIILASPMIATGADGSRGTPIDTLSGAGYTMLMSYGMALAALLCTYVAATTTFSGVVDGRLVARSDRNLIARISLFGMRNPRAVLAAVLVFTMVAGYYASAVNTNVDVADVMPRGDPNTVAAKNLTAKFKSSFTQQVTFQFHVLDEDNVTHRALFESENARLLPNRVDTDAGGVKPRNMTNITDELYIRAMAEAVEFFVAQDPFVGSVAISDLYKLINWTVAGGDSAADEDFGFPDTSPEGEQAYTNNHVGVTRVGAVYTAADALASPNWTQTAVLVTVGPEETRSTKFIGQRALEVRDAYVQWVKDHPEKYQVFGEENPPQFSVDLPIANAHASALTEHDFKLLLPIIAVFITLALYVAFRSFTSVIVTFSMLAIAVTWTFGFMGRLEIPLNTLNLAVVPLIMGIGIDYGIHMMNEYQEARAHGKSPEESWIVAGGGSALALFVGTVTTIAGLMIMVISPSLIVSQLGILAAIAIASCYLLAVLFIPALVTLLGERGQRRKSVEYQPSVLMPKLAAGISRVRWLALVVLVMLAASAVVSASGIHREAFGDPPRNWLPSDPLSQEHSRAIQGFYETPNDDVKANILIIEGDITDPDVHTYINGLTGTLRANALAKSYHDPVTNKTVESRVIADTLKDLPFLLNTYLTVRGGAPGAGAYLGGQNLGPLLERAPVPGGAPVPGYPETREEVKEVLDSVFASPLAQLGNLFVDAPDYEMTVIVFSARAASYSDAESVWGEVQAAIAANEDLRPEGTKTSFFGNTAINYLFVAKQVPWLGYMSAAATTLVFFIVLAFTRSIKAAVVVGLCSFLTSTLWIGFLPFVGIGLAISLTLPLVFIFTMGSDYGLHLAMRCRKTDTRSTMESVGKGVLFSFITTFGSFLVFTQLSDLAGRRAQIATAIAIAIVFLVTLTLIPIFYPVKKAKAGSGGEDSRNVPVVDVQAARERSVPVHDAPIRAADMG